MKINSNLILPKGIEKFNPVDLLQFQDFLKLKGFANNQGVNEWGDIITQAKDGAPLNGMWDEFQKTIQLWNRQRDALTNLLSYKVSNNIESVRYPMEEDFEEASEFGEPKGIRLGPSFKMGFDFKWWDLAIRYTWQFLADADSRQLQALNNTALEADNRLVFTRILRQIFNNTTRTAVIDELDVNVYPFYNGDSQVPPKWKNTTHSSAHDHYLESGSATANSADFDDMENHLYHHGYTPTNGYTLLLLVNRQEAAIIRGFTVAGGDTYTFIPSGASAHGAFIEANGGIVGRPNVPNIAGLNVIGTYGPWVVVEEDYIPANYAVGLASGGIDNIGNPVGIREHENTGLRGLRLVKGRDNDYPLIDSFYLRGMGTGIRHRGAGVVMEFANGGTYTVPSAYA